MKNHTQPTSIDEILKGRIRALERKLADAEQQIEKMYTDPITGVRNHLNLHNRYPDICAFLKACYDQQIPVTICYSDFNGLKKNNDTHGHQASNEIMKMIIQGMVDSFGQITDNMDDLYFREHSGDEFIFFIMNHTPPEVRSSLKGFERINTYKEIERTEEEEKHKKSHLELSISYGLFNILDCKNPDVKQEIITRLSDPTLPDADGRKKFIKEFRESYKRLNSRDNSFLDMALKAAEALMYIEKLTYYRDAPSSAPEADKEDLKSSLLSTVGSSLSHFTDPRLGHKVTESGVDEILSSLSQKVIEDLAPITVPDIAATGSLEPADYLQKNETQAE